MVDAGVEDYYKKSTWMKRDSQVFGKFYKDNKIKAQQKLVSNQVQVEVDKLIQNQK
mgnify:FL=1